MKKSILTITALITSILFSQAINVKEKGIVLERTIHATSLENNLIEEELEQPIAIYLPKGYETDKKEYPVVYFLPGFGDSHTDYIKIFSEAMDKLGSENKTKDMIIVTINGHNKFHGSFYYNSPIAGNWEDFITKDVINYVDKNFRTIKSSNARGIVGHSMGGFGVINLIMQTNDLFDYAYSMSPGVFAEKGGLEESDVSLDVLQQITGRYQNLTQKDAETKYLDELKDFSWDIGFSLGYASAFAPDPESKVPYIKLPKRDNNGNFSEDETWSLYYAGFGDLKEKTKKHKNNLLKLKGFIIEYGKNDEYQWIPKGCEYFSEILNSENIRHEKLIYDGDHQSLVGDRIKDFVLPFFSEAFYNK